MKGWCKKGGTKELDSNQGYQLRYTQYIFELGMVFGSEADIEKSHRFIILGQMSPVQ